MEGKFVFMFSVDWCGDCKFIELVMFEIEVENEDFVFYYVDWDEFIDLCVDLVIFGILSFLVFEDGEEVGCFVSKDRKIKEEINDFLVVI